MSQNLETLTPPEIDYALLWPGLGGSESKSPEFFDEIPTLEPPAPSSSRLTFKDNPFIIYVILTLVVLISCLIMFQKSQQANLQSRRTANFPAWLDNPKIIYPVVGLCSLLAGSAAYSTNAKIGSRTQRHTMWIGFAIQIVFLVTWFYYTYVKPSGKTAGYLAVSFLLTSAVLTVGVGAITYEPKIIGASLSTVLLGLGLTAASLRGNKKTA